MILIWYFGLGCFCLRVWHAFSMILETKLFPLHGYCFQSLQALENYIWVVEWARLFSIFLRVSCVLVWKIELGWKLKAQSPRAWKLSWGGNFWVQDFLHEPEVLLVSLAPLGSTLGLGSCKRSERNRLIPSKSHFLNFPISHMGLGHT